MSDDKKPTPPAAGGGAKPAGGCVADCPEDPCGKDAVSNVTKCCGTEIFEDAKKANGGKDPTIVMGTPSSGFAGETQSSTGTITVSRSLDKGQATQVALFELANLAAKPKFDKITADAAAGKLSREEYTRAMEQVEYDNLKRVAAVEDKCMDKWGLAGETPRHAWVKPAKNFDDYYDNYLRDTHKNHYRNAWDTRYKTAYEAKHPPVPKK